MKRYMSNIVFCDWLNLIHERGIVASQREAADLLGVGPNTIIEMKRHGADRRTAYACQAILQQINPFGASDENANSRGL